MDDETLDRRQIADETLDRERKERERVRRIEASADLTKMCKEILEAEAILEKKREALSEALEQLLGIKPATVFKSLEQFPRDVMSEFIPF